MPDPPVHSKAMSDLAPFVAATLRDKVIYELLEENKKLQERVRASMTVEITGQERLFECEGVVICPTNTERLNPYLVYHEPYVIIYNFVYRTKRNAIFDF